MLHDKKWRMNNLYRIINKDGQSIPFKMNPIQEHLFDNMHTRNLVLKSRQVGLSTFAILYVLDDAIFQEHKACGVVSYSLEHAQHILKKIVGHALESFPEQLRKFLGITQQSARQIIFDNGSHMRVDTSLRGGTCLLNLITEFGKTCARNPVKAEEIVTGTLQAVPIGGKVIIESTGEGTDGYFADMVRAAVLRGNDDLNPLEYKLFFYPWMDDLTCTMDQKVSYPVELTDYFDNLERELSRTITQSQRNWYALKWHELGVKVKQEYPSTISEAFLSNTDAFYFAEGIGKAHTEGRALQSNPFDALLPLYAAMDIGLNDLTVIIFFQLAHGEIRIVDYYEDKNKDVDFYAKFLLQDKKYLYHTIFLPHDSTKRDPLDINNSYERDFRRLFSGTATKFHVLPKMDKQLSISHARVKLDRCVFNYPRVKPLMEQLSKYRKKWNEATGRYLEEPLHTIASNHADAYQYLCQGVTHLEALGNLQGSLSRHRQVVENRTKRII